MSKFILIPLLTIMFLASCKEEKTYEVKYFNALSNFDKGDDTIHLKVNLSDALLNGIVIPSDENGKQNLLSRFAITNHSDKPRNYYYKIFYQNETYKHDEKDGMSENLKAKDNFYGSWVSNSLGFHKTPVIPNNGSEIIIMDSLRIVGNPRNEKKYFGADPQNALISENSIVKMMEGIKSNEDWFSQIKEKAVKNSVSVAEQLRNDAKWTINRKREQGDKNNRWKRNPRVGAYSFLLVVVEEEKLNEIPEYLQNITIQNPKSNHYENPYYHFLYNDDITDLCAVNYSNKYLKISAEIDLSKGIYSNISKTDKKIEEFEHTSSCDCRDSIFYNAHVEQFFHNINKNYSFENTRKVYDVVGDNYTVEQFKNDTASLMKDSLIKDHIQISNDPCATLEYDNKRDAIIMKNPGNDEVEHPVKENVGIKSRHGFTYGKFKAKIAFPEIVSQGGVWNGLTCAFWLIFQEGKWNQRGTCEDGYFPKRKSLKSDVKYTDYSEIDIEIVKTSKYWPKSSYKNDDYPVDDALNNNVMVTVTNWDLACHDPEEFNVGVHNVDYKDQTFTLHRWDDWYKAVTSKFEYPQDKTLGKPIYYEIEWRPNEIIWRMGEDEDNMVVIGYMNEKNTKIPDNQMVMVVTQEFHDATWWPTAPFSQNDVPFPLKDIEGYIYEMTIE